MPGFWCAPGVLCSPEFSSSPALCYSSLFRSARPGPFRASNSSASRTLTASSTPIAIVPINSGTPDQGATVTGALEVTGGRAMIATSGTVTAGARTTDVLLPRRGTLRVCASTSVKLAADSSVPAGETPGLLMAIDRGALEMSFATLQTPTLCSPPTSASSSPAPAQRR